MGRAVCWTWRVVRCVCVCIRRVRLSMCLSVRDHIFGTTRPIFTKFLVCTCVQILTGSGDGSCYLWDMESGEMCICVVCVRRVRLSVRVFDWER